MDDIILKNIPGFPGYAITQDGRIWSYSKKTVFKTFTFGNKAMSNHGGKWLKGCSNKKSYVLSKDGKAKRVAIASILALVWGK